MRSAAGFIVITFCLTCHLATARLLEPNCGIRIEGASFRNRIIGGSDVKITAHPWMAYLHNDGHYRCAGTLINHQFVLTAAHCIDPDIKLTVRLGGNNLRPSGFMMCQPAAEDYEIARAIRHKYYTPSIALNDIAMLRLARSVEYSVFIRPICIILDSVMERLLEEGMSLTATGWGRTEEESLATDLQVVPIELMHPNICSGLYDVPLGPSQLCAGDNQTNTCSGDSGGPLGGMMNYNGNMRFFQYAITSFGDLECRAPSVYTDLSTYFEWIEKVVNLFGTQ
ncbi:serine protease easter [Drosophila eugracilis]|uniref:serine protease easter n=1 Tax=Drosophila eugracilis TaxID=29029 RepID=UPI001BDB40D6|nr:serine protease easter [Drosophila eugracilis]